LPKISWKAVLQVWASDNNNIQNKDNLIYRLPYMVVTSQRRAVK